MNFLYFSGFYYTSFGQGEAERVYPCDTCNRTYRRLITLQRHKKLECGKEATFECILCNSRFKHKHSLQRHLKVHLISQGGDQVCVDDMWRLNEAT